MKVLLLLFAVLCTICLYQDSSKRASLNHVAAFMFHQTSSITQPTSYFSPTNENSSNFNSLLRQRQQTIDSRGSGGVANYLSPRNAQAPAATQPPATKQTDESESPSCPNECHCNRQAQIVDCSNRNLIQVPKGFPRDTKRIRLERNNITELGAHSFQGLKRLQRIDLSNNNLSKIDPLAFAGGLQSLNSLILYSNKLNQLPVNLFSELSQLQLLLLNANSLQCIHKDLFQPLANLNLLSLYDNGIETLSNGTLDGLKNIKTIHLGKNPLICDCNLRWLADYLDANSGVETSEARCEAPARNQAKKISQLGKHKFRCEADEQSRSLQIAGRCEAATAPPTSSPTSGQDQSGCPTGCECTGSTVDCSRASKPNESGARPGPLAGGVAPGGPVGGDTFELPDIPDDIPVHVIRMHINDTRIKRIRQTGLFRRLAQAQKLDLGNNRIVDIEDNNVNNNGGATNTRPERVVFVLLENDQCDSSRQASSTAQQLPTASTSAAAIRSEDACVLAPRVVADSPCYNGGSCISSSTLAAGNRQGGYSSQSNYSCLCPPGFAGFLCEVNIDDCAEHQCQNGAMCVDGVNAYKCVCRDPTTSGEFCEQFNSYAATGSALANSIAVAPMALPMVARPPRVNQIQATTSEVLKHQHQHQQQQILARSADLLQPPIELSSTTPTNENDQNCKRVTQKKYYEDGNGCQSIRMLKVSECMGTCAAGPGNCCSPSKVKRRRVRMQCTDGASYVKTVDLVKKCSCSSECSPAAARAGDFLEGVATSSDNWISDHHRPANSYQSAAYNASQEDQLMQITRLDAVE